MDTKKIMTRFESMLAGNRLFEVIHDGVKNANHFDPDLLTRILNYIWRYCDQVELNNEEISRAYMSFIRSYNKDMKRFAETAKYPLFSGHEVHPPTRIDYDLILMLSTVFTAHRFRIMQLVSSTLKEKGRRLFVGCGPGLEMGLLEGKSMDIDAYDISLNPDLRVLLPEVSFFEAFFTGEGETKYEHIYLIELLEHLEDPFQLLSQCRNSLTDQGKIHLTTATNIPQFDHLYNFDADAKVFTQAVEKLGFQVDFHEKIMHETMTMDIGAQNDYYILSKI